MSRIPLLPQLLGAQRVLWRPLYPRAREVDAVIGWGKKANTKNAIEYAERHELPYWRAEDGLLRSVGLGAEGAPPLSIVLDDRGMYYDARKPSRLEALLNGDGPDDPLKDERLIQRSTRAMKRIREAQLSKYNNSPPVSEPPLPAKPGGRVLVVDQTRGDLSVRHGLSGPSSFDAMLKAAIDEHPEADIIVKTHPDVVAGKKRGYLQLESRHPRVKLMAEPVNPIALLEQVDHVYVVTSQLGFEALLVGKPVTCFGAPFYAGWGLTDDRKQLPRRAQTRSVEQLFAAAYILYAHYVDPDTGQPCELERVIEHITLQRAQFARNRGAIYCFGFRVWKRNYMRAYLRCPGNRIEFPRDAAHARRLGFDSSAKLLVWGQREPETVRQLAADHGVDVWRVEDGFLRSVGLGSDMVAPASLVVDREGIYYDPTGPSELETILQNDVFTEAELERAHALRKRIVETGLSKYNVGRHARLPVPDDKRVVLVPGQVEDDASIQLGCRSTRTNRALLEGARERNPNAFIIYKPHPDVLSGNRRGHVAESAMHSLCDHVELEASLADCLRVAHEVHTLTSLVGFEALLRELSVVTYGQPFYNGWGLTEDQHPVQRRTRRLSLDELVAGVLIRYPRYLNRASGTFTTPELIISELTRARDNNAGQHKLNVSWSRRQLRKLFHIIKAVTHAP
jgi:capsular polysaccharide export protein